MAAEGGTPHLNVLDLLPFKENLDRTIALLGGTYYGEGPVDSGPLVYGLLAAVLLVGLSLAAGFTRRSAAERAIPEDRLSARTLMEVLVETVLGVMSGIMGERNARRFLPLIGTLALFIFFSNLMGAIPGLQPPTSSLNTTLACALPVFLATHVAGVKDHGLGYFKHFFGPIRKWYALPLMVMMFLIEMISHIARPLSLSVRLFGNMMADHTVVAIFLGLGISTGFVVVPLPVMALGLMVAVVQTLVFSILSMVYINLAIESSSEGH